MKVAVIRNSLDPEWQSCKTISQNLISSYELIAKDNELTFFNIPIDESIVGFTKLANEILEFGPKQIVWVEYQPTPSNFLSALSAVYSNEKLKPNLKFHIYGDFVLNTTGWASCGEILKEFPTQIIAASEKQQNLLDKLIDGNDKVLRNCPFPVDSNSFSYSKELRDKKRKSLGIENDELLIIYSGRLSFQKNIYHMLYSVKEFLNLSSRKVKFLLAGPIDDLGMPYVGRSGPLGAFYGQYANALEALDDLFKSGTFQTLGNIEQDELKSLYCASDLLLNLSTHNDEDYGMAPAEALCCGCPSILSNWGGFYSFNTLLKDNVRLVDVKKEKGRFLPSYSDSVKALLKFNPLTEVEREKLSVEALDKLGVEAIATILENYLKEEGEFNKYSDNFLKLLAAFTSVPSGPFKSHNGSLNDLYFQIYSGYGGKCD